MYPHDYIQQQPLTNYDMSAAPGRTYRYYENKPLFAFGMGLSLTQFSLKCNNTMGSAHAMAPMTLAREDISFNVVCTVTNTGKQPTRNIGPHVYSQIGFRDSLRMWYNDTIVSAGARIGDEVVQVYHQVGTELRASIIQQHPVPLRRLVEFERVTVCLKFFVGVSHHAQ